MFRILIGGVITLVIGISFLVTRVIDDVAPAGATDVITVWDQSTARSDQFQRLVERTAVAQDMTVLKEVRSESGSAVVRREYVSNPAAVHSFRLAAHAVTGFDPTLVTRFLRLSELPSDRINGMYLTDAGTDAANRFAAALADEGVTVTVAPLSPVALALWVASEVPAAALTGALSLVLVIGVVAWQSSRRGGTAIRAAFGRSRASSSCRDAASLAAGMAAVGAVAITATVPTLVAVDNGARLGLFLAVAASGVALASGAAAVTTLVASATSRASITHSIGGARPWRSVLAVSLVGNVLVLALVSSAATTVWTTLTLAREDAAERVAWQSSLDDVRLSFTSSNAELDAAEAALAAVFTRLDDAGTAVLADHAVAPDLASHAPDDGNVLLVNSRYLDEQTIRSPSGDRVTPATIDPEALTLLVPEGVRVSEGDRRAWQDFLRFQRSGSAHPQAVPDSIDVDVLPTATHRVFTYATDDLWSTSVGQDTVIAVIPSATPSLSENLVVSDMTSGEVVFTDPDALRTALAESGLTEAVATIEPLRDLVSYRSVVIERSNRQALAATGVLVLALAVSAASICRAHAMIRRRRTDITITHGRSGGWCTAAALVVPLLATVTGTSAVLLAVPGPVGPAAFGCGLLDALLVVVFTAALDLRRARPGLHRP
jgi:hypothetical protein